MNFCYRFDCRSKKAKPNEFLVLSYCVVDWRGAIKSGNIVALNATRHLLNVVQRAYLLF